MPGYVVEKITNVLNEYERCLKGSNILILGVTYKPDVRDIRESPALDILQMLQEKGAKVSYCDPFVDHLQTESLDLKSTSLNEKHLAESHCVVIVTHHKLMAANRGIEELGKSNLAKDRLFYRDQSSTSLNA